MQKQENKMLLEKIKSGDKSARDKLIMQNLKYVQFVSNKVLPVQKWQDRPDIFECGVIGLIKAVDAFKEGKASFETLAYVCIRNEILMFVRHEKKHKSNFSLNDKLGQKEGSLEIVDTLKDDFDLQQHVEKIDSDAFIKKVIESKLNKKQAKVITGRYFLQKTQAEICEEIGFSQSACSKCESKAKDILKKCLSQTMEKCE